MGISKCVCAFIKMWAFPYNELITEYWAVISYICTGSFYTYTNAFRHTYFRIETDFHVAWFWCALALFHPYYMHAVLFVSFVLFCLCAVFVFIQNYCSIQYFIRFVFIPIKHLHIRIRIYSPSPLHRHSHFKQIYIHTHIHTHTHTSKKERNEKSAQQ